MGKLTVDECKRIIIAGRRQLTAAGRRIAELERENAEALQMLANQAATIKGQIEGLYVRDEMIRDLWTAITWMHGMSDAKRDELRRRIRDMGIDLDGEV